MTWERIKELFHEAVPLDEAGRRELLAGVDAETRREVELLLEAHVESPREEDPGARIGRYKILQQIGEGGFGVVHMAEQMEPVRRRVALKVIKLGMDSKQIVARFEAERQALAMMDHPNIAQVFDGGVTATGRPFFVMELVKGVPITEYCRDAALGMRARLELFQAVCRAVQHAHQKGVIHRDLKPSNVMVTLHDGKPVPKVIDFGVAKATGLQLTDKTLFTEFKTIVGTPEYMAPEQAEMSGLDVDTRADIYSLGVLLYELLTGTKPFDLVRKGYEEILRTIREEDPPKPSTRASTARDEASSSPSLRTIGRDLRGDLDWIVMRSLEKDRARRYETADAFAADIGHFLADEPVSASPPSTTYRLKKYIRRNRALVGGALAVIVALSVGLVIAYMNYRDAERARGLEAERAEEARTEADKARTTVELLDELLGGTARAKQGPNYPLRKALLDFDARVLERLKDQPEVEAQLRLTLTRGYLSVSALDAVEKQLEALRPLADVFSALQRAKFHSYDAQHLRALDRYEDALAADQRALAVYEKVSDVDRTDVALVLVELAEDYMNLRRYSEAEKAAKQSIATYEAAGYEAGKRFGWDQLGRIYQRQNKLALAEQYARRALEASRAAGFVLPADEHSWACLLAAKGDYAAATKAAQRALDAETEMRGPGTILGAQVLRTLALTAHRQGDLPRARKLAEEALAIALTTVEARGSRIANYHSALGGVALSQRDLVLAEKCVRAAIAALERFGKADTPAAATQFGNLGLLLTNKGEYAEADRVLTRAAAAARKHRDLTGLESALRKHAGVLVHLERPAEGERLAREAVDLARSRGIDHPDVIYSLGALTQTLMAQRKWEEAEQAATEVLAVVHGKFGPDAPMLPDVLTQLGLIGLWRKNYEAASRRHKEAYVAYRRRLPPKHPKVSRALRQLIESSIMAKKWSLVARAAEDELKLKTAPRHESLELLARGLSGQAKHAAAEKVWRLCHDLRAKSTPDDWTRYRAMSYLGACLLAQDKLDEAEPLLIEAYEKMKPPPIDAADRTAARARVVALYEKRGMPDKAAAWRARRAR